MTQQTIVFPQVKSPEYMDAQSLKQMAGEYQPWVRDELRKVGGDELAATFFRLANVIEQIRQLTPKERASVIFSEEWKMISAGLLYMSSASSNLFPCTELTADNVFLTAEAVDIASRANPAGHPPDALQQALKFYEHARLSYAKCFLECMAKAQELQEPALQLPMDQLVAKYVSATSRSILLRMSLCIAEKNPEVHFTSASFVEVVPHIMKFPPIDVLGDDFPDLTVTMQMLTIMMDGRFLMSERAMAVFLNTGHLAVICGDAVAAWAYYTMAVACVGNGPIPRELEWVIKFLQKLEEGE